MTRTVGWEAVPPLTVEILVVYAIVILALILFVMEPLPIDVTAVGILVVLVVLKPWTRVSLSEGVSGFSNPATLQLLLAVVTTAGITVLWSV